jgi:two-component system chemotaxis response regulator CheY
MRILIAEDDNASRLILEAAIGRLGHEFVSAQDGFAAWKIFQQTSVDAIISDRSMPMMDGVELCRRIRAAPGAGYPYFIFLTSFNDKARIMDALNAGADDYLGKPLDPDELAARLVVATRITDLYRQLAAQQAELELLNSKLFAQSRIDPLTQLGSRRKLAEDLELVTARVERYGERYCAVMCDVDHFKRFNDTYGHLAGDEVLRSVARTLANECRGGDQVYRYGGEEFLLVLPSQSLEGGHRSAERLRAAIEALNIPHAASPSQKVTVSMGVALICASDGKTTAQWVEEADAALYRAKESGRNRVIADLAEVKGGALAEANDRAPA